MKSRGRQELLAKSTGRPLPPDQVANGRLGKGRPAIVLRFFGDEDCRGARENVIRSQAVRDRVGEWECLVGGPILLPPGTGDGRINHRPDRRLCSLLRRPTRACRRCAVPARGLESPAGSPCRTVQTSAPCGLVCLLAPVNSRGRLVGTLIAGMAFGSETAANDAARLGNRSRARPPAAGTSQGERVCGAVLILTRRRLAAARAFLADLSLFLARAVKPCGGAELTPGKRRLHEAVRFVRDHCAEALTAQKVARRYCLSPRHFSRLFKAETGWGFKEYLRWIRVGQARQLLADGNLRVKDVAARTGFDSVQDFDRVFRSLATVSPKRYRALVWSSQPG